MRRFVNALSCLLVAHCFGGCSETEETASRNEAPAHTNAEATEGAQLGSASRAAFNNPLLWLDLADIDVFRVDNTFFFSASTMHYSPGAPILRSYVSASPSRVAV